jgi:hypothetical protein
MPVALILSRSASSSAWSRETGGVGVVCQGPVTTVPSPPVRRRLFFAFLGLRRTARLGTQVSSAISPSDRAITAVSARPSTKFSSSSPCRAPM